MARKKRAGKMRKVMGEYSRGELHSGSKTGPKVESRKQAIAIGMSEARKAGEKVGKGSVEARRKRLARASL